MIGSTIMQLSYINEKVVGLSLIPSDITYYICILGLIFINQPLKKINLILDLYNLIDKVYFIYYQHLTIFVTNTWKSTVSTQHVYKCKL